MVNMDKVWKGEYLGGFATVTVDRNGSGFDIEIRNGNTKTLKHVTVDSDIRQRINELNYMGVYAMSDWKNDDGCEISNMTKSVKKTAPEVIYDGNYNRVFESCRTFQDNAGLTGLTESEIMTALNGRDPQPFLRSMSSKIRKARYGGGYLYTFLHGRV